MSDADSIDWDALVKDKMGEAPATPAASAEEQPVTPPAPAPVAGEEAPAAPVTPPAGEEQPRKSQEELDEEKRVADEAEATLVASETPEQTTARHQKDQEDADAAQKVIDDAKAVADAEEAAKAPLTAADLQKQLDARDAQVKFDAQRFNDISVEVTKDLYPNGFDTTLKDEAGHVIANAADYKQYIDPNATTEDAERTIMNEQARLNGEIQQAKDFILEKAELKHNMENEAVRVFTKYKDFFLKHPDIQPKIAAAYNKTLKLQGSTIIEAPQTLEDFYDFAMEPYVNSLTPEAPATPVAPVAPATPPAPVKATVKDERLDLMGSPSGQDDGMTKNDGTPNWGQIVKNKMKG